MGLKDLIVDKKQLTEAFLEKILKNNIELIKESKGVNLTKKSLKFSNKTKVLLYLCGKKAWELIDESKEEYKTSISELSQTLGVLNNTMRSILKGLKDDGLVFSEKGKYHVSSKGALFVQNLIETEEKKEKPIVYTKKGGKKRVPRNIGRPNIIQKFREKSLSSEYVEEILPILEKSKHQDRYLLAIYISQQKMEINSLTASEINILLSEPPFKLPKLHTSNISRDLGKMRKFVTPYKVENGFSFEYRITSFGEKRVKDLIRKYKEELTKK